MSKSTCCTQVKSQAWQHTAVVAALERRRGRKASSSLRAASLAENGKLQVQNLKGIRQTLTEKDT